MSDTTILKLEHDPFKYGDRFGMFVFGSCLNLATLVVEWQTSWTGLATAKRPDNANCCYADSKSLTVPRFQLVNT